jgi:hypothetical protein
MIEEDGHIWDGPGDNRCHRCQIRYSYWAAFISAAKTEEYRKILRAAVACIPP